MHQLMPTNSNAYASEPPVSPNTGINVYADVTFAPREANAAEENAEYTAQHVHE